MSPVVLKNEVGLLPSRAPSSVYLVGNKRYTKALKRAATHCWPKAAITQPRTRHPIRLATQARDYELVVLCVSANPTAEARELPPESGYLIDKLGWYQQTITVLLTDQPVAVEQWHKTLNTLVWAAKNTEPLQLLNLISGKAQGGALPFPLPFYTEHLQKNANGEWQQTSECRPAFPQGTTVAV